MGTARALQQFASGPPKPSGVIPDATRREVPLRRSGIFPRSLPREVPGLHRSTDVPQCARDGTGECAGKKGMPLHS